jgi:hypothetical protein
LFRRSTNRRSLERCVTGLLTDLPRNNGDTLAQAVANTSLEQVQHLLTDAHGRNSLPVWCRCTIMRSQARGLRLAPVGGWRCDPSLRTAPRVGGRGRLT